MRKVKQKSKVVRSNVTRDLTRLPCDRSDENLAEHPSGLSGEHDVVLDAIHQECLHGRE